MNYTRLNSVASSQQTVEAFGGYNHNLRIGDGEFYDEENLSCDQYPVLSLRAKRSVAAAPQHGAGGLIAKDSLCYTSGSSFYINGYGVDMGLAEGEKQLISMGAYVIILPDKKWVNTMDTTKWGNIENTVETQADVTFSLCMMDGEGLEVKYTGSTQPKEPKNLEYWLDTGQQKHSLKIYSESSDMWTAVGTTYVKIRCPGIGVGFEQYDGIQIDGLSGSESEDLKELNGSAVVWARDDDYLVVVGLLDAVRTVSGKITVSRTMPVMDFVTECNNRLWGCRYGLAENGEVVNEIYASKLGDFKNWKCYMGISTDSYTVSLGSDGPFTGAITHQGYPVFFKENCLHKMYGSIPANFQIQTTNCRGVEKGSEKSLAIVNEVLYYKGANGVCAYDGSLPGEISSVFGSESYRKGVAGAYKNKYYISLMGSAGRVLFVYDTAKGIWHKETGENFTCFCQCRGELYAILGGKILAMAGSAGEKEGQISWQCTTGIIGCVSPNAKYLARLNLRLWLENGANAQIWAEYDSGGTWEHLGSLQGYGLRPFTLPVKVRRCDHLRLKITGQGNFQLYAVTKTIEQGSDLV